MEFQVDVAKTRARQELLCLWNTTSLSAQNERRTQYLSWDPKVARRVSERYSRGEASHQWTRVEKEELKRKYAVEIAKAKEQEKFQGDVKSIGCWIDIILESLLKEVSKTRVESEASLPTWKSGRRGNGQHHRKVSSQKSWYDRNRTEFMPSEKVGGDLLEDNSEKNGGEKDFTDLQIKALERKLQMKETEVDMLTGHLERRNNLLEFQRQSYFKELAILKEQLFQKRSSERNPQDWGSYFDHQEFQEIIGADAALREHKAMVEKLQVELNAEREKLQSTLFLEKKKLTAAFEKKHASLKAEYEEACAEAEQKWIKRVQSLQDALDASEKDRLAQKEVFTREAQLKERKYHEEVSQLKREHEVALMTVRGGAGQEDVEDLHRRYAEQLKQEIRGLKSAHEDERTNLMQQLEECRFQLENFWAQRSEGQSCLDK